MRLLASLAATSCARALAVIVGQTAGVGAGVAEYYVFTSGVGVIGYRNWPAHDFAAISYVASHLQPGILGTIVHVVTAQPAV
jgi:hypothetical protein